MTVLTLDPSAVAAPLPHEQVIPSRVERIREDWRRSGIQHTPVLLFERSGALFVADGHHRIAAARELGTPVRALLIEQPRIEPAHRWIHRAPSGWFEALRAKLTTALGVASSNAGGLGLRVNGTTMHFDCAGISAQRQTQILWDSADFASADVEWSVSTNPQDHDCMVILPAFTVCEVVEIALARRQLLPPRSTNFQPKPLEGSIQFPLFTEASANVAMPS